MKVSVLQESLNWAVGVVRSALPAKVINPITGNILLRTDQSRLKMTATDLETMITCWVPAKVEEDGEIACASKFFIGSVESLPSDKVDLTLTKGSLHMQCLKYKSRIASVDPADYPEISSISDGITFKINTAGLKDILSLITISVASDMSRAVLTGVNLVWQGNGLTFSAADGFRLSRYTYGLLNPSNQSFNIIIPAGCLRSLIKFLTNPEEDVEISLNPNASRIQFRLKNIEVISSLIQGRYPDVSGLIPTVFATTASIDVSEGLRAVRFALVFSREGEEVIKLYLNPGINNSLGNVTTKSTAEEAGENEGIMDSVITGPESKIAFKGKLLLDAFSALKEGKCIFKMNSPTGPAGITKTGDDKFIYIVMPMFTQW